MSGLLDLTAAQAAERIAAGELDAEELFGFYRDRASNDQLGSYLWVAEGAPETSSGPLAGVPLGVKDLFCVKGVPSAAGSRSPAGYPAPHHPPAVERLTGAGAPVLGKTNMDEFAMGSSN